MIKRPKIVAILNQKGGAGKTTLATNIAMGLHLDGLKVLLVDSDKQGSARDWHAAGNSDLAVIGIDRPTLDKDIQKIGNDFEWIIIDGVPQLAEMAVAAIKCSDLIIVPVQPSPYDIWATEELIDIIKVRQNITNGIPIAYSCVSSKMGNTLIGAEAFEALEKLGIPTMKSHTCHRVAYKNNVSKGKSVYDTVDEKAITEITNIINEIKEILK